MNFARSRGGVHLHFTWIIGYQLFSSPNYLYYFSLWKSTFRAHLTCPILDLSSSIQQRSNYETDPLLVGLQPLQTKTDCIKTINVRSSGKSMSVCLAAFSKHEHCRWMTQVDNMSPLASSQQNESTGYHSDFDGLISCSGGSITCWTGLEIFLRSKADCDWLQLDVPFCL